MFDRCWIEETKHKSFIMTTLGFTSNFVAGLEELRRKLDDFVETNKKTADCQVADLKKIQADEQQSIDSLLRQLRSLQYERGVAAMSRNGSDDNATGGLAVQRKKFESKQVKLEEELSMLKSKNRIEQAQLDGAYNCSVHENVVPIFIVEPHRPCNRIFHLSASRIQRY
jgi:hypothetical protein